MDFFRSLGMSGLSLKKYFNHNDRECVSTRYKLTHRETKQLKKAIFQHFYDFALAPSIPHFKDLGMRTTNGIEP